MQQFLFVTLTTQIHINLRKLLIFVYHKQSKYLITSQSLAIHAYKSLLSTFGNSSQLVDTVRNIPEGTATSSNSIKLSSHKPCKYSNTYHNHFKFNQQVHSKHQRADVITMKFSNSAISMWLFIIFFELSNENFKIFYIIQR